MKLIIYCIVCSLTIGCYSAPAESPLKNIYSAMESERYSEAESMLSLIIDEAKQCPENNEKTSTILVDNQFFPSAYLFRLRARCRFDLKKYKEALQDYQTSYNLEKDTGDLYWIAHCLYDVGMYDEAINKFDEYLTGANPSGRDKYLALYFRAFAVFAKGDMDMAISNLKELQQEFPEMSGSVQGVINQAIEKKKEMEKKSKRAQGSTRDLYRK